MRNISIARLFATALVGLFFGAALSRIGFSNWTEVQRMFLFEDFRLFGTFVGAVVLLIPVMRWIRTRQSLPAKRMHPGIIPGGLIFGAGWAITGACPAIALVQIGEGKALALWSLGGIFVGIATYQLAERRWIRWQSDSCNQALELPNAKSLN